MPSNTIRWSSQVTHTAMAIIGLELFNATYTTSNGGSSIYALGTVFDIDQGQVKVFEPKRKIELGSHTDERAARAACESFCRGEILLPETSPSGEVTPAAFPPPGDATAASTTGSPPAAAITPETPKGPS